MCIINGESCKALVVWWVNFFGFEGLSARANLFALVSFLMNQIPVHVVITCLFIQN
jgi:hypothetical protein